MGRALRLAIPSGRYYVTARGNERRPIFRQGQGVRLHAHVLMSSHYHYPTVAKAMSRFGKRLAEDRNLADRFSGPTK